MLKLTRFRIPSGWHVLWNNYYDPTLTTETEISDLKDEDLLQMKCESLNLLLDIGWYGGLEDGAYTLNVFEGDFHGKNLVEYTSTNHEEITNMLEEVLENARESSFFDKFKGSID